MQSFAEWSLSTLREGGATLSWLEESRFEWSASTTIALEHILNAKSIVLIVDEKRKWFERYILSQINEPRQDRPFVSIVSIDCLYPSFGSINSIEMLDMLEDTISTQYNDNFFFWYIGVGDDKRADLAKKRDSSYFWIFDEEYPSAFSLKSYDKELDIKLIQLYKLFDKSLSAAIFSEIALDV
ncbi:MAG: HobA family DNA replication regulator [Sulfurimonas sp.]|jgi:hypothetical protein|nr:HobA family DNA replication regulator [Sulfurimonadaceae bacterium]